MGIWSSGEDGSDRVGLDVIMEEQNKDVSCLPPTQSSSFNQSFLQKADPHSDTGQECLSFPGILKSLSTDQA